MKKYKISVIGDIGIGMPVYNGQTAKTRDYIYYLSKRYGEDKVCCVDTRNWKRQFIQKAVKLLRAMFLSEVLVLVLGKNGRKTILPVAVRLKDVFKNKVLFSIVGGSLMYDFFKEPVTVKYLSRVDGCFVETKMFKKFLEEHGVPNVYYSPVFSKRPSLTDGSGFNRSMQQPYRFCTYSRVSKEKGISTAIDAICKINKEMGKTVCKLDIYGIPQPDYKEEFEKKLNYASEYVEVHPYLVDNNAISTLAEHYMMLFPTYYSGEGFPIAIIECLKAGLPVIASNWHFNSEVIINGQTGLIYDLETNDGLIDPILWTIKNPQAVYQMKKNCLEHALLFDADTALASLYAKIDGDDIN